MAITGITWGLPSRRIDPYLFGGDAPWPGEKIARLANAASWSEPSRGADVDRDPLTARGEPIDLTATEEDVAAIYLRYRLYTHQPDEMITMRALAGMRPGRLQLDPKLYQYGGLFIYPVGVLIKLCGILRLIDVRSDLVFYLDHPDEFGKFYVAARAYVAAWGAGGVLLVYSIATRLRDWKAGASAALLFALMPVVVCMSHEAKPHLPGAVLMLAAVWFAMRYLDAVRNHTAAVRREWLLMCAACGAALGMVLTSAPILVVILLAELMRCRATPAASKVAPDETARKAATPGRATLSTVMGLLLAAGVYFATNPYVAINAFAHREVLRSNFGNSLAMYELGRLGEGLLRVTELTVEGAGLPVVIFGVIGLIAALLGGVRAAWSLAATAAVFFLQFVSIGAGKPAEYGRFGIFPCTALAISTACILARRWTPLRAPVNWIPASFAVIWTGFFGSVYLRDFQLDALEPNSRTKQLPWFLAQTNSGARCEAVTVWREPAPYCCPPLPFCKIAVCYVRNGPPRQSPTGEGYRFWFVAPQEDVTLTPLRYQHAFLWDYWRTSPISWANKRIVLVPLF